MRSARGRSRRTGAEPPGGAGTGGYAAPRVRGAPGAAGGQVPADRRRTWAGCARIVRRDTCAAGTARTDRPPPPSEAAPAGPGGDRTGPAGPRRGGHRAAPRADAAATLHRILPLLLFLGAVVVLAELTAVAGVFDVLATRLAIVARGSFAALFLLCVGFASLTTIVPQPGHHRGPAHPGDARAGPQAGVAAGAAGDDHGLAGQHRQPAAAGVEPDQPARRRPGRAGPGGVRGQDGVAAGRGDRGDHGAAVALVLAAGSTPAPTVHPTPAAPAGGPGAVRHRARRLPAASSAASWPGWRSASPPPSPPRLVVARLPGPVPTDPAPGAAALAAAGLRHRPVPGGADPRPARAGRPGVGAVRGRPAARGGRCGPVAPGRFLANAGQQPARLPGR